MPANGTRQRVRPAVACRALNRFWYIHKTTKISRGPNWLLKKRGAGIATGRLRTSINKIAWPGRGVVGGWGVPGHALIAKCSTLGFVPR